MEREYWWFSDAGGEFIMRRVTDDDWAACGSDVTIDTAELERSAKRLGRVMTYAQGVASQQSGLEDVRARGDLGVRWMRTAQSVVNELLAHIATLEAMLAQDGAHKEWFMIKPVPNDERDRLSCIVCGKGHEEHLPVVEWLVTVRADGQTICKGLHEACWRRTAKMR